MATIFHNVTLPRSWILKLAKIKEGDHKAVGLYWMLVEPMSELLEQMYSGINGGSFLFYSGVQNIGKLHQIIYYSKAGIFRIWGQ
jgi:hypothetical protein